MSIALTVMVGLAGGLMLSDFGIRKEKRSSWLQAVTLVLLVGPVLAMGFGRIDRVEPLWAEWTLVIGSGSVAYLIGKFFMRSFGRHRDRDG